jgi:hypothetical protein
MFKRFILTKKNRKILSRNISRIKFNRKHRIIFEQQEGLKKYDKICRALTELVVHKIDGIETRGWSTNNVDHIVPIAYGYFHNIPVDVLAGIDNLVMLSWKENCLKGRTLTDDSIFLLKKWGYFNATHCERWNRSLSFKKAASKL